VAPSADVFREALERVHADRCNVRSLARIIAAGAFRLDVRPFVYAVMPFIVHTAHTLEQLLPTLIVALCERLCVRLEKVCVCVGEYISVGVGVGEEMSNDCLYFAGGCA
jgi:hypothetical protein